jgi:hypothetical protein
VPARLVWQIGKAVTSATARRASLPLRLKLVVEGVYNCRPRSKQGSLGAQSSQSVLSRHTRDEPCRRPSQKQCETVVGHTSNVTGSHLPSPRYADSSRTDQPKLPRCFGVIVEMLARSRSPCLVCSYECSLLLITSATHQRCFGDSLPFRSSRATTFHVAHNVLWMRYRFGLGPACPNVHKRGT